MKKISLIEVRRGFKKIQRLLRQGEEVQIKKRRKIIARRIPESENRPRELPDFLGRFAPDLW